MKRLLTTWLVVAFCLAGLLQTNARAADSARPYDIGEIYLRGSVGAVRGHCGAENVRDYLIPVGNGRYLPGLTCFPLLPQKRLDVALASEDGATTVPVYVRAVGRANEWRLGSIHAGMSAADFAKSMGGSSPTLLREMTNESPFWSSFGLLLNTDDPACALLYPPLANANGRKATVRVEFGPETKEDDSESKLRRAMSTDSIAGTDEFLRTNRYAVESITISTSGLSTLAAAATRSPRADPDWLIAPGLGAGKITTATTESGLIAYYGRNNVADGYMHLGGGDFEKCTVLFPDDPTRSLRIRWKDEAARSGPDRILVQMTDKSFWRTKEGIGIGTTLNDVAAANGSPFEITGFEVDAVYGRTLGLDKIAENKGGHYSVGLQFHDDWSEGRLSSEEGATLCGNILIPSANPLLRKLNPRVVTVSYGF